MTSLATATVGPPVAIYREEQWFGWWAYAGLGLVSALAWVILFDRTIGHANPWIGWHGRAAKILVAGGVVLPPALVLGALRMVTLVTPAELRISFGFLPTYKRVVALDAINHIEVVQYHPIRDYGGWGLRFSRDGERIYNARGSRGVRIQLRDGSRLLIGSQRPEELARALEATHRTGI